MTHFKEHQYYEFWENLKDGWDWFEEHKRPPSVTVEMKNYQFSAYTPQ